MPDQNNPLLDRVALQENFGQGKPAPRISDLPNVPFKAPSLLIPTTSDGEPTPSALSAIENGILSKRATSGGKLLGGSIPRSVAEVTSPRYDNFVPGDYNNEDAYAQGQGWADKMVNSVGKGLSLTGTTFLQSTAGLLNGLVKSVNDGRAASFYDNDFNRTLDEFNKRLEDTLPNYYTDAEKNASWYSPSKLFSANFLWDGIVKNLGFAAGAALSGAAYTKVLSALPLASRLFSVSKAAEVLKETESALLAAEKATETYGRIKGLSDKFLSSYNSLNPGGRALVAGLATTGEASFEAYQNLNEFRDTKIQEYKDSHNGQPPVGADLEAINTEAEGVGNSSFLMNVALLSATNYIQFPKILGSSYTAEKGMINSLTKDIGEITKDATGKFIQAPVKGNRILRTLNAIRPYTFSASEGFEEGAQFAISVGTKDYYNKKYSGDTSIFMESLLTGVSETFGTDEGIENILIGGLSGSIMLGRGRLLENKRKRENTAKAITAFNKNKISDFTKETIDSVKRGIKIQEEREQALVNGKVADSKDLEFDYIINYLTPRIKYGRYDLVSSDLNDLKALASSEEGFAQLQSEGKALAEDTREAFLNRLQNLQETAANVKSLYQSLNLRFGSIIDKEGKPLYSSAVMDKMVYAASKIADYDNRIEDLNSQLSSSVGNIDAILDASAKGDQKPYEEQIKEIESLKDINKDKLLESFKDLITLSQRRQQFFQEYEDIKKDPKQYQEEKIDEKTLEEIANLPEEEKTISIKTKKGETEVVLGEQYFVGKVISYDKNGKEIIRFPTLTILAENEDGTIKIQDKNGIRNISKSELQDYNLGKVSSTTADKKAMYYMSHANTIFEFNFGKGKTQRGRLEYSPKEGILLFVYKNKKGDTKKIEVTGDQFIPQPGYSKALISPVGEVTSEQAKAAKEFSEAKDNRIIDKRTARLQILNNLFEELLEKQENSKKLLSAKKTEFKNIVEELVKLEEQIKNAQFDARYKKSLTFKSQTRKALEAAMRLSRAKEQLENEIADLEAQVEDLEFNASYIAELAQNIDLLPTDSKDFIEELRIQRETLNDLIANTGIQIANLSSLIENIENVLDKAIDFIKYNILQFEKKYPKTPLSLGQEYVDFLKENPNFLKLKPQFKEDLKYLEDLIAQTEDLEINPSEEKLKALKDSFVSLQKDLDLMYKELGARDKILSAFEDIAKKYQLQKEEEAKIAKDEVLLDKFLGTHTSDQQNNVAVDGYQPERKKDDEAVLNGTVPIDDGKPHQKRANNFGINYPRFDKDKKSKLKILQLTSKTEGKAGIPGLTAHLVSGTNIRPETVVVAIIVKDEGNGKFSFVDENGEVIPLQDSDKKADIEKRRKEEQKEQLDLQKGFATKGYKDARDIAEMHRMVELKWPEVGKATIDNIHAKYDAELAGLGKENNNLIDKAIYQVRPTESLRMNYSSDSSKTDMQTMFRDSTHEDVREDLTKKYAADRAAVLESEELQPLKDFSTSFGILQYSKKSDKDGNLENDYGAKNAVEDTGLIEEGDLSDKNLVEVATTNKTISENGVTFSSNKKSILGRVFLRIPGLGIIKLNSNNIGRKRAETIFDTILQISKNVMKDKDKGIEESKPLFSWLSSVIYWGIPKDLQTNARKEPSYNSVWFEEVEDGTTRLFVSGKGENFLFTPSKLEENREAIILLLENMYHNTSASLLNKGLKKYREITGFSKDGVPTFKTWENYQTYLVSKEGRKSNEIPLTTPIAPVKSGNKANREGIYFVIKNNLEVETAQSEPVSASKQYVFDGKTPNTYVSPEGKKIVFTISADKRDLRIDFKSGDIVEVLKALKPVAIANNPEKTDQEVKELVINSIANKIRRSFETEAPKPKRSIFAGKAKIEEEKEEQEEKPQNIIEKFLSGNLDLKLKTPTFVDPDVILSKPSPTKNKVIQKDLKERLEELNELLKCLSGK